MLEEFSKRVRELKHQIDAHKKAKLPPSGRLKIVEEYRTILKACQETPRSLRRRMTQIRQIFAQYQKAKRGLSEEICGLSSRLPKSIETEGCRSSISFKKETLA